MTTFSTILDGTAVTFDEALVARYDRPGPRYTSYPTAPQWRDPIDAVGYRALLAQSNQAARPLSLYAHLPFCEAHCTFCGCNVIITKQHQVSVPYLDSLHREVTLLGQQVDRTRPVTQFHLGGGTPTYQTPEQLCTLWERYTDTFTIAADAEVGLEADPRVTTIDHLTQLRRAGFNRLSMGVQDFTPAVQTAINRCQSFDQTRTLVDTARTLGYASINIDLIYGLPHQTAATFARTVAAVLTLAPDRVACYSFAYVPWLKAQQRTFDPATLPDAAAKLTIWCQTIAQFADAGYDMIGFDHFARPTDELVHARTQGTLWRNFQGYTTKAGTDLIACGLTGISDVDGHYVQNVKKLPQYHRALMAGELPVERACHLTADDRARRACIRYLLCHHRLPDRVVRALTGDSLTALVPAIHDALHPMARDGLLEWHGDDLHITPLGRLFARNIAMTFDAYLDRTAESQQYSRTV